MYAVIIGAEGCGFCRELVRYARERRIPHRYFREDDLPGLAENASGGLIPAVYVREGDGYTLCGVGLDEGRKCLDRVAEKNR